MTRRSAPRALMDRWNIDALIKGRITPPPPEVVGRHMTPHLEIRPGLDSGTWDLYKDGREIANFRDRGSALAGLATEIRRVEIRREQGKGET